MRRRRPPRHAFAGAMLMLAVGLAAAACGEPVVEAATATTSAAAARSHFTELDFSALDATIDTQPSAAPEAGVTVDRGPASPSLDVARAEGLFPFQWPWFSDEVPTPADALVGGSDLAGVLGSVSEFDGFKVLSAERWLIPGEADLQWRHAWVKVNDNELLAISTQLITDDLVIPAEGNPVLRYAGGEATVEVQTHAIYTRFVRGERMVLVDLQLVSPSPGLSMTGDEVLALAEAIMDTFDSTG